jgi:thiamine biosynthesis lipoprotein
MTSSDLSTAPKELPAPVLFPALGTTAVVAVTDQRVRSEAAALLTDELRDLDRACSRFRDDSELARLNRASGRWCEVSPLFLAALEAALDAARTTDGLVDPTIGQALRVLGYDRDFASVASADAPLRVRVARIAGSNAVEVDHAARRVRLPRGIELDLGATAKAFAADRAARHISAVTGAGVIVSLGGDCALAGDPPAGGWTIRVTDRHDAPADAPGTTISLAEGGLATSGITARRWRRGERELHHIIDPRTGWPAAAAWRTASAVAPSCLEANVATTAAIVLGGAARHFLEARGLPARLVAPDGSVVALGGWPVDHATGDASI